jgi:hypothetical protein
VRGPWLSGNRLNPAILGGQGMPKRCEILEPGACHALANVITYKHFWEGRAWD